MRMATALPASDQSSAQDCQLLCRAGRAYEPPRMDCSAACLTPSEYSAGCFCHDHCKPPLGALQQ